MSWWNGKCVDGRPSLCVASMRSRCLFTSSAMCHDFHKKRMDLEHTSNLGPFASMKFYTLRYENQ